MSERWEDFVIDVRVFPGYESGRIAKMPASSGPVNRKAKGAASRHIYLSPYVCTKEDAAVLNNFLRMKSSSEPRPYKEIVERRRRVYWCRSVSMLLRMRLDGPQP